MIKGELDMGKMYKMFLLSVAVCIVLNGCAGGPAAETERNGSVEGLGDVTYSENEVADSPIVFEGYDMDGNAVSSEIFAESKLTMVNVWATYCNPCLREMPGLGELANEYDDETFQIIGVVSNVQEGTDQETMNLLADLIEKTEADYTHLLINESLYYALLTDVAAVPTTFFVNADGVILDTVVGSMDKSAWEEKINELLEEQ
jgi:thiol-disulfide isomerase/thioredoxin